MLASSLDPMVNKTLEPTTLWKRPGPRLLARLFAWKSVHDKSTVKPSKTQNSMFPLLMTSRTRKPRPKNIGASMGDKLSRGGVLVWSRWGWAQTLKRFAPTVQILGGVSNSFLNFFSGTPETWAVMTFSDNDLGNGSKSRCSWIGEIGPLRFVPWADPLHLVLGNCHKWCQIMVAKLGNHRAFANKQKWKIHWNWNATPYYADMTGFIHQV